MLKELIFNTKLLDGEALRKRERDLAYLLEVKTSNLLLPFYFEAGINGSINHKLEDIHWGWDGPLSHLRGMFTGHWLSAAARIYQETNNMWLKIKSDEIVSEIEKCQIANGGLWPFSIPEKYLYSLKAGRRFWAPHYVCHKIMMGLLDMYLFANNKTALEIIKKAAEWFINFTSDISLEVMDDMMDLEETGALMEFWLDLYEVTKDEKHLLLARKYERRRLTEPLYLGIDVLTNMHANTTIPEIHGCARMFEITGEEKYKIITENYWNLAVIKRGAFATGGQTNAEIWTPMNKQFARLSEFNQEHCVVYNLIRLADYLYRWTGKSEYADYIEINTINGLFAQGFWESRGATNTHDKFPKESGIVAYFLPLKAGSKKKWGSKTEDFWCCHGTVVQANAKHREYIYYKEGDSAIISQYIPSIVELENDITIKQEDGTFGEVIAIKDIALEIEEKPKYKVMKFSVTSKTPTKMLLKFRIPKWVLGEMIIYLNNKEIMYSIEDNYALVEKEWLKDIIEIRIPKDITCYPLADEPSTVAFLDGPVLLAGLVSEERTLYGDINEPETIISSHNERNWNFWTQEYKTKNQDFGFYFKPIKDIGNEKYTVYFPVRKE